MMRVLVACEFSGIVRDAFLARGYDAMSCDLLPSERPGPHYCGDVRDVLGAGWDMMVGHPPCTFLANSGVRWLHSDLQRWRQMDEGVAFFLLLWQAPIARVAIENPIMHGYARRLINAAPAQVIQPWMFGHGESKATCLWLRELPPLYPTRIVLGREQRVLKLSPSPDRWRERSRTYEGIAAAMAAQWGDAPLQLRMFA